LTAPERVQSLGAVWGIRDYRPYPVETVEDLVAGHGVRLNALVGRGFGRVWGQVFVGDGEWCSTAPVVLDFDGWRLELAAEGWHRLYLTWDELDLAEVPDEYDTDDPDLEVAWQELDRPELRRLTGLVVREVRVLRNDFRFEGVDGRRVEAWVLGGLEFVFEPDGSALQVYNCLNELALGYEDQHSNSWLRDALPRQVDPC
jgi:hypothetical protein